MRHVSNQQWVERPPSKRITQSPWEFFPDSILAINDGEYYLHLDKEFSLEETLEHQTVTIRVVEGKHRGVIPDSVLTHVTTMRARDGADRQWTGSILDEFSVKWQDLSRKKLVEPTPLLVPVLDEVDPETFVEVVDREAEREIAVALVDILPAHAGTSILTTHSPFNVDRLTKTIATLVIDSAILKNDTTRQELEIILHMLEEAGDFGRLQPIWLVETEQSAPQREALQLLAEEYDFVEYFTLGAYRKEVDELEKKGASLMRIGYEDHKDKLDLLDIELARPREGEVISAFSFMSLALGKDPVFEKFRGVLQEALEGIEKVLVITPSVAYLEAVETIHTNL